MSARLAALLASLAALLSIPATRVTADDAGATPWLFLVYHDADCNLEAPMMRDIEEMLAVGSSDAVKIVALIDRHPSAASPYTDAEIGGMKDWSTTKLCEIEKGHLVELADLGEKNLGDPATLSQFVVGAVKRFPAKHVALVLGDHGMAWPGICSDDSNGDDHLTLDELQTALAASAKAIGHPIDLLGFDACLMANLEVAEALAPFAHVLVASEELEPGSGWDYTPVLDALEKAPETDALTLGKWIADHYQASFRTAEEGEDSDVGVTITLSVVDLTKIDAVVAAAHALGAACQKRVTSGGREGYIGIARARARAEEYGRNGAPGAKGMALHDLVDLAYHDARESKDEAVGAAAKDVEESVAAAVAHVVRGKARPDSNGLSIYMPVDRASTYVAYASVPFAKGHWGQFVEAFGLAADADTEKPGIEAAKPNDLVLEPGTTITVTGKIASMDDLDDVHFVLGAKLEQGMVAIGLLPEEPEDDGALSRVFDGSWFALEVGDHRVLAAVTDLEEADDEGTSFLAEVPAQVREKGQEDSINVTLTFLVTVKDDVVTGEFVQAVAFEEEGPREIPLDVGDVVIPVYVLIDEDGTLDPVPSTDKADELTIKKASDIRVSSVRVPAGDWIVGFLATDLAENSSFSGVPITIK